MSVCAACPRHVDVAKYIDDVWLHHIGQGTKTIEGRLGNLISTNSIKPGMVVKWSSRNVNNTRCVFTVVQKIRRYDSIASMLHAEGIGNVLPGTDSVEEGVEVYQHYYSDADVERHGMVALHLRLLHVHNQRT